MRKISCRRFDTLGLKINQPCFLKIDAEGSELQVLEGFGDMLNQIDLILLEFIHKKNSHEGQSELNKIMLLLEKFGFGAFIQMNVTYCENGDIMKSDLLFYKN